MRTTPKIGFTERGDGGLDLSWVQKCEDGKVDGVVVVTKQLTPQCQEEILRLSQLGFPVLLHYSITGWGGTQIEPNVSTYTDSLNTLNSFIQDGFPAERAVLRIDPIFPTPKGLARVEQVLQDAFSLNLLPAMRCRISILDEYQHVKERFRQQGFAPIYGEKNFSASPDQFDAVTHLFSTYPIDNKYETCAEPMLKAPDVFVHQGCLSERDLQIMGFDVSKNYFINPQNRHGCLCLGCKTELVNYSALKYRA